MQGTLSGFVVLVLAVWGKYVFNRLWQRSLLNESAEAILAAQALGLHIQPLGYGPKVVLKGCIGEDPVKLVFSGGLFGERVVVRRAHQKRRFSGLRSAQALQLALQGNAEE